MTFMLLENGVGQFTLISTRFFDTYMDAVDYWATHQYKKVLDRLGLDGNAIQNNKEYFLKRYSGWGDLYEAKAGSNPKRIKEFHIDVYAAMTRKNV